MENAVVADGESDAGSLMNDEKRVLDNEEEGQRVIVP